MPAGAYGDSIGGMTIAGGIAAALFADAQISTRTWRNRQWPSV
jgi:hypothetical protein